ncbi:hypothetical protein QRX41_06790 [Bifidobacterium sp. H1HS16N]|uniref:Uncharacterized protein n=1 Tax=Bifidobacterium kimbladii TaxID=1293826 RepID=A0ABU3KGU8_9BIFI|nr:hypothetical protein [Bifidobacterium sp. H1HS16N]MDT7509829.1 hypothetical protein [Bifidobacterium sp. H1HS16N]
MKVAQSTQPQQVGESTLVSPDSRGRIMLGKSASPLYKMTKTPYGYTLERATVITDEDRELQSQTAFWDKITKEFGKDPDGYETMEL